ncbi:MAG: GTPase Era [Caldicoprobacterales bacterium]|mgnify:FL=1|jgi:GTP-binding protein Era|nr:GTPase Era [Clostridiales bacterium]
MLSLNFTHLKKKGSDLLSEFRSGFAAIIGRANVGKSSLMNALIGEKLAIVSDKPQTTRNRIQGVLTRQNYQIVFVDTPGIHKPKNKLGEHMVKTAQNALSGMEVVLFVVDIADGIGYGDHKIVEWLKDSPEPVILVANKIDIADKERANAQIEDFQRRMNFDDVIAVSALNGTNIQTLEKKLYEYLPEGPKYYPDDMMTDQPERVILSEIIREKALHLLKEEVPHGIGVDIESIEDREGRDLTEVRASIICEKSSHKGIIIGKGGKMLKAIGSLSRADMEKFLGTQVYLELFVKVKDNWRNDLRTMRELGYDIRKS